MYLVKNTKQFKRKRSSFHHLTVVPICIIFLCPILIGIQTVSEFFAIINSGVIKLLCCSLLAKSCPTLGNLMDCSLPGFSVCGISRQEYWNQLPFPPPGDLPDTGMEPELSLLHLLHCRQIFFFLTTEPPRKS